MARLLADENLPGPVVQELRRLGHDAVTLHDLGCAGLSVTDERVLELATEQGRAVVTLNRRHFIRMHTVGLPHAGIVVCSFDLNFTAQAARIDAEIARRDNLARQLIRVNRPSH